MTRARDLGIPFDGNIDPKKYNTVMAVDNVLVGHQTIQKGTGIDAVNTGVTAVLPLGIDPNHGIDTLVPAGWFALNGNGEMTGTIWIEESGFLEGPIMITDTLNVGTVRNGVISYAIQQLEDADQSQGKPFNPDEFELNLPIVAETSGEWLNGVPVKGISSSPIIEEVVWGAIDDATNKKQSAVEEGNFGGGTGMTCYDWKGGIGTSSRYTTVTMTNKKTRKCTVGVLVQANQGKWRDLVIRGVPVGEILKPPMVPKRGKKKSSIVVVIATDAPLLPHQLKRLARRASHGVARTGTYTNDDSGEIFIAFSTDSGSSSISNSQMDPLFRATVRATEEAIINALVAAQTAQGIPDPESGEIRTATAITDMKNPSLAEVIKQYNPHPKNPPYHPED
jgi:L-aminopeptidase/D-esterase-like protein